MTSFFKLAQIQTEFLPDKKIYTMEFASAVKRLPCYEILVVFVVTIRLQRCYEFTILS